jgi:hypothetical protein
VQRATQAPHALSRALHLICLHRPTPTHPLRTLCFWFHFLPSACLHSGPPPRASLTVFPRAPPHLQGRLDLFFLCLAALMLFNLLLFLWVRLLSGGRAAGGSSRGGVQSGVEGFGVCRPGRSGGWMS